MKTIPKRILNFILVFFIITILQPQNFLVTSAAVNAEVYEYSPMLEDNGDIYYIQTVEGKEYTFDIYRLEIATGNKTRLSSSKTEILSMMIHNNNLYYSCFDGEKDVYYTYAISVDSKNKKTICNGYLLSLDDNSIYYTVMKGEESKLYKRDYNSRKATLIYTGNMDFSFAKNLDNTLYFTQFDEASSKLTLYKLMPEQTKLAVVTTDKITLDGSERTYPKVSDIAILNGDIYYQYGVYEGTGDFWYGTLKKLDLSTNTKSVIAEQLYEEQIYHNDNSIFYNGTDSSKIHYQYNTRTGKTSSYIYRIIGMESFNILGDKTYCANPDGKDSITVSCFKSGTNKTNLDKSFINFSYKQDKKFDYSARVIKYGDYFLVPVTCMDFNTNNGWRGKCVSVNWYVADSDGKILAQFR